MRPLDGAMRPIGWAIGTFTVVLVLAACGSNASTSQTPVGSQSSPSPSTEPAIVDPLDGTTWRNTFTWDDVSKALEQAGLQKYEKQVLRPDNLGQCDEEMHTTLEFSGGEETVSGEAGGSPQPYELVNDHTMVVGFQRVTFQIQGNQLILDLQIIKALYPYSPKELLGEQAFDLGFTAVPFVQVG
jgi:hypothetical protein